MNTPYSNGQHVQRTWSSASGGGRAEGSWANVVKRLDAFPKQREEASEFFQKSTSGGIITIVTAVMMAMLFVSELGIYLKHRTTNTLSVRILGPSCFVPALARHVSLTELDKE